MILSAGGGLKPPCCLLSLWPFTAVVFYELIRGEGLKAGPPVAGNWSVASTLLTLFLYRYGGEKDKDCFFGHLLIYKDNSALEGPFQAFSFFSAIFRASAKV